MWNFSDLRESASSIFRKTMPGAKQGDNSHHVHKDAMNNLVTPQSIIEFTLPPIRKNDSIDDESEYTYVRCHSSSSCEDRTSARGLEFGPEQAARSLDRRTHEVASPWTIRNKLHKKKSDSRSASPAPHSSPLCNIIEPAFGSPTKSKVREIDDNPGMSLQHLVERKEGFDLLSESPNTKRKESLFLMQNDNKSISRGNRSFLETYLEFDDDFDNPQASSKSPPRKTFWSKSDLRFKMSEKSSKEPSNFHEEPESNITSQRPDDRVFSLSEDGTNYGSQNKQSMLPSVRIRLSYSLQCRRMAICILEGKDLHWRHSFYFKISLLPHDECAHIDVPKPGDANPKIEGEATFENVEEEEIPYMTLKIACKEKTRSRIRHGHVLGAVVLPLFDFDYTATRESWVKLLPLDREEHPHLLLSACYDDMLGCLTIDVLAARSLPKGKLGALPDTFVTLKNLSSSGMIRKQSTKTVLHNRHPVFRQSFIFSLPKDDGMDQLVIEVSVYVKYPVRGAMDLIGSIKIGQDVETDLAKKQFAKAVMDIKKPVVYWHPLKGAGLDGK